MPVPSNKHGKYRQYNTIRMETAVRMVREQGIKKAQAARQCGVPRTTLIDILADQE